MNDRIIIRDETLRAEAIKRIWQLDLARPQEVVIRPYRKNRSLEQNALLWSWYAVISEETGHTAEEIHEFCKAKFLQPHFVDIAGEVRETRRTTTKLKVDEMSAFMDQVYAWATGELGLMLPIPDEQYAT